jgi:hypothetical protein
MVVSRTATCTTTTTTATSAASPPLANKLEPDVPSGCLSSFGNSVALSADGTTAIVGGWTYEAGEGAAWVFTRSGSNWTQQAILTVEHGDQFGSTVALSADGNTALIDEGGYGIIFTRSGSTWTQGATLHAEPADLTGGGNDTVALSADGNTAIIGERELRTGEVPFNGGASIFAREGSTWTQQGPRLEAGEARISDFGSSVALSANGATAMIAGYQGRAAAWMFTRSGSVWSRQGPPLTGSEETNNFSTGESVALSGDGNTALLGYGAENNNAGAGWIFTRSGSVWTQQGPELNGSGAAGASFFGESVALSGDGDTALVGGPHDNPLIQECECAEIGAAWEFRRTGSAWSQSGPKLVGTGAGHGSVFGHVVALSATGDVALIGGPGDNGGFGAAWPFVTSAIETAEYTNWAVSGSLTPRALNQPIGLPSGSTFNGRSKVNKETGAGSVSGNLAIPAFTAPLKLFGVLPVALGLKLTPEGAIAGTVAKSETVSGDEMLSVPMKLGVGITSVSLFGLKIPTTCPTAEPLSLSLVDNLTREELLTKGWSFAGSTTIPKVKCEGGLLASLFGHVLSALLSGPENAYAIKITAPGG